VDEACKESVLEAGSKLSGLRNLPYLSPKEFYPGDGRRTFSFHLKNGDECGHHIFGSQISSISLCSVLRVVPPGAPLHIAVMIADLVGGVLSEAPQTYWRSWSQARVLSL